MVGSKYEKQIYKHMLKIQSEKLEVYLFIFVNIY